MKHGWSLLKRWLSMAICAVMVFTTAAVLPAAETAVGMQVQAAASESALKLIGKINDNDDNRTVFIPFLKEDDDYVAFSGKATGGSGEYEYGYYYHIKTDNELQYTYNDTEYWDGLDPNKWNKMGGRKDTVNVTKKTLNTTGSYVIRFSVTDEDNPPNKVFYYMDLKICGSLENISSFAPNSPKDTLRVDPNQTFTIYGRQNEGVPKYKYSFYHRENDTGNWTLSGKENQDGNTRSLSFSSEGMYGILVRITDNTGEKKEKTLKLYVSDSKREVENLSGVKDTRMNPNKPFVVTGAARYGYAPYKYAYYYRKNNTGSWVTAQSYSNNNTCQVALSDEGMYALRVLVKDANGTEKEKVFIVYVSDSTRTVENLSVVNSERKDPNELFKVTGAAQYGYAPYKYACYYRKNNTGSWVTAQSYSNSNICQVALPDEGMYALCVYVKDANGTEKEKDFTVYVSDSSHQVNNRTKLDVSRADPNQGVNVTITATGGYAPYTITYAYKKDDSTSYTSEKGLPASGAGSITFSEEGKYVIRTCVKDRKGATAYDEHILYISDSKKSLKNNSTFDQQRVDPNTYAKVRGIASCGYAPYKYSFYYRKHNTGDWTLSGKENQTTSYRELKFGSEGIFDIRVVVKDANGNTKTKEMELYVSDSSKTVENLSKVNSVRMDPNQSFVLTGAARYGYAPYTYACFYQNNSTGNWVTSKTFSESSTFEVEFADEGKHVLRVSVRDAKGKIKNKDFVVYVSDSSKTLSNESVLSADRVDPQQAVTATAAGRYGYAPYTYSYYYRKNNTGEWTLSGTAYTTSNTRNLKFAGEGKYGILVRVKDAKGKIVDKTFTLYVSDSTKNLEIQSTVDATHRDPSGVFTVTANGKHGYAPYLYMFYYKRADQNEWTKSGTGYKTSNTNTFRFAGEGMYYLLAKVKDAKGTKVEKWFAVYVSDSTKQVENISTLSASRVNPNEKLIASAKARYGYAPYTYSFYYRKDNTGDWNVSGKEDRTYSENGFTFTGEGKYGILVKAKDANGKIAEKTFTVYVSDSSQKVSNSSTISARRVDPNATLTATAKAKFGYAPYTYSFYYRKDDTGDWLASGKEDRSYNVNGFKFSGEGKYGILVRVKDAKGTIADKTFTVYVSDSQKSFEAATVMTAKRVDPNEKLIATVTGKYGYAPYTYSFYYRKDDTGDWIASGKEDRSTNYNGFTFSKEGKYGILTRSRDSMGTVVEKTLTVYVSDSQKTLSNSSTLSAARSDPNEKLLATAGAQNGYAPYTYSFYYRNNDAGSWIVSGKEDRTNPLNGYKFAAEGKYGILVRAKDAKGTIADKTFVVYVSDSSKELQSQTVLSAGRVNPGQAVTATVTAKYGYAPYTYAFYYRKDNAGSWTVSGTKFGTANANSFRFTEEGMYAILVKVKDAKGTVVEESLRAYVSDSTRQLQSNTVLSATHADPGKELTATAEGKYGYAPYTYAFYYRKDNVGSWTVSGEKFRAGNVNRYKFTTAGMYALLVKVKDSKGTVVDQSFTVYVSDSSKPLQNNASLSATRVDPGELITVTAKADYGYAPYSYAFFYRKNDTGSWTLSGTEYKAGNTNNFKFTGEGKYGILVRVKDASGTVAEKQLTAYVSDSSQELENNAVLSAERVDPGQELTATAKARYGYAPYTYSFYYRKDNTGEWTLSGTAYTTSNTQNFKFAAEGKYGIRVRVKDAKGKIVDKTFTMYVSDSTKKLENLSTVDTTRCDPSGLFTVTAKGRYGYAPYSYVFYYKRADKTEWTMSGTGYKTSNTNTFRFAGEGMYYLLAKIKDAKGTEVEKKFAVYVSDSQKPLENDSTISATHADPGQTITVMAKGKSGYAPYTYAYYYRKDNAGSWNESGTRFGTAYTNDFSFSETGMYVILVKVKDANGTVEEKRFTVYVSDSTKALENDTVLSENRVDPDQTITATVNAAYGYAPYSYAFYYRKKNAVTWISSGTEYRTSNVNAYKWSSEGAYELRTSVKDARGTTVDQIFTVFVSDSTQELENDTTLGAIRVDPNESVKATVDAVHGSAPYTYTFYYRNDNTGTWNVSGEANSTSNVHYYSFSQEGKYGVRTKVTDAAGKEVGSFVFTVYVSDSSVKVSNESTISTTSTSVDEGVTVYYKGTGGYAPYAYTCEYCVSGTNEWIMVYTAGSNTESTVVFDEPGTYDVRVQVKDMRGNQAQKIFKVTVR